MEVLAQEVSFRSNQNPEPDEDATMVAPGWANRENAYDQMVSDRWATSFDPCESEKAWVEAVVPDCVVG